MRSDKQLAKDITTIAKAVEAAKARTIKRINIQLARMSPNDLQSLERLIGKRR
jgi:hypothetical protein